MIKHGPPLEPSHCKMENAELLPCGRLDAMLQENNCRKKGLSGVQIMSMKRKAMFFIGARYVPKVTGNGVMLNFCPWCGRDISVWDRETITLCWDRKERNSEAIAASVEGGAR